MLGWFDLYPALLCLTHFSPSLGEARGKAEGPSHRCSRSLSDNSWRNICHDCAMVIFCHSLVTWQPMEGRGRAGWGRVNETEGQENKRFFCGTERKKRESITKCPEAMFVTRDLFSQLLGKQLGVKSPGWINPSCRRFTERAGKRHGHGRRNLCGEIEMLALGQFKPRIYCLGRRGRNDVRWFDHTKVLKCQMSFFHRSFGFGRDHWRVFLQHMRWWIFSTDIFI